MDLQITDLDLLVGARVLISRLSASCRSGELWCVLGKNGSGKSTLLKTLAGMRAVQQGSVLCNGRALARWPIEQLARQRGYLPQLFADSFSSSVLDTVLTGRFPYHSRLSRRFGLEQDSDVAAAHAALAELGLAGLATRDVLSLSGGERAQVALATVFAQQVELLLLDEPAAHLDVDVSQRLFAALRSQVDGGRCVIATVHDPNLAARFASHVLLLMPGGGWLAGPVELLSEPALSELFGHPMTALEVAGARRFLPT